MVEMGYCIEVEKSAMLGYDSRYAVAELFCNRSLTDVLYCDYILKLKWNMDPSHPTKNVSPGDGSDWQKEMHCFLFSLVLSFLFFLILCMFDGGL